ncbi:MAG: ribosome maturation factor RimP [Ruminococcaceae bacterium]|nr:ribosome maturation factor RimP [Oscillospiraceae bacterium]
MASNKKKGTAQAVWELVEPIVESFSLKLWDVRFVKEGAQWFLRVFIDKEEGKVDITDCENVSRAIDKPLDELDPITDNYILEVSSPGVERELVLDAHFEQFIGADIMVRMIRPIENIGKDFKGVLKAYENGLVTITDHSGENEITINKKDAAYIKLDDFDI